MKQNLLGQTTGTLMPYVQAQLANYQRTSQTLGLCNVGINYLINGHNGKLTVDYQNRPYYRPVLTINQLTRRGGWVSYAPISGIHIE